MMARAAKLPGAWFARTALLLVLAGCGRQDSSGVRASGQIEATEVRLATKVPGTVRVLAVQEGDLVVRGQRIAQLDTVDLEIQRKQIAAERDQAAANFALVRAGSRAEDIASARAEVDARRADLESAERDLGRANVLLESGTASAKARDDALLRRDLAKAAFDASVQALKRLTTGARPEERAAARASLAAASANLAAIEQRIADCTIRSPIDGTVTEKLTEAGELLTAGAGVAVVGNLAQPWLTVFVTGADLPRVRLGAVASVTTDAPGDRKREGRVTYVSPTAEFTPRNVQTRDERVKLVYRVKIQLDNRDGGLKPGMPAEARIATSALPEGGPSAQTP